MLDASGILAASRAKLGCHSPPSGRPQQEPVARPTLYHMDIAGTLRPGLVLDRRRLADGPLHPWQVELRGLVPGALSRHGEIRLLAPIGGLEAEAMQWVVVELCFELVRRERFPMAPSRLSVVFAADSLEFLLGARARPALEGFPGGVIYEIQGRNPFRADQAWTWSWTHGRTGAVAQIIANAQRYWTGEPADVREPYWEYLLTPPVQVLRRVDMEPCPAPTAEEHLP
jgi:hypothetical protein